MTDFRGTPQPLTYVWQGRKPLVLPGGGAIRRGETLQPTVEMIPALQDLMVPVGESLRVVATEEPATVTLERDTKGRFRREEAAG